MQAVILSGGAGTRLHPLTRHTPKPMLPIDGRPHLAYQLDLLRKHGIRDIIFSTGYLHHQIQDYFGDGRLFGVRIQYKEDGEIPLGTGGAIKNCAELIEGDTFLVLNGDILTDYPLSRLLAHHKDRRVNATLALAAVEDPSQYGVCVMEDGYITQFVEKPTNPLFGNLINAGIYVIDTHLLAEFPSGFSMIETDLFPLLAKRKNLGGLFSESYWLDIGTHVRYNQANKDMQWKKAIRF